MKEIDDFVSHTITSCESQQQQMINQWLVFLFDAYKFTTTTHSHQTNPNKLHRFWIFLAIGKIKHQHSDQIFFSKSFIDARTRSIASPKTCSSDKTTASKWYFRAKMLLSKFKSKTEIQWIKQTKRDNMIFSLVSVRFIYRKEKFKNFKTQREVTNTHTQNKTKTKKWIQRNMKKMKQEKKII